MASSRFSQSLVAVAFLGWHFTIPAATPRAGLATRSLPAQRVRPFLHDGVLDMEGARVPSAPASDAPTGFANLTNGFDPQGPAYDSITDATVVALRSFNDNRFIFEQVESIPQGLGPSYNAQSCRECHQNIVTGGASQITVLRIMRLVKRDFFLSPSGDVLQSRGIAPGAVDMLDASDNVRALRMSPSLLGDGYVEALANDTLLALRDAQPEDMRGIAVIVPVLESAGRARVGRFGWKSQHASLESFAADAYLNEMGITSPLLPNENARHDAPSNSYDAVADPEDDGRDVMALANFVRATMPPPRGPQTPAVAAGLLVFERIRCGVCHVASLRTAAEGTSINGGALQVARALGNTRIHPFSDFLLHDIGTGDGIPVQPGDEYAATADAMRTTPLWGLRTRNRLMHDGLSYTLDEAILRHRGQAKRSRTAYLALTMSERTALLEFLRSL